MTCSVSHAYPTAVQPDQVRPDSHNLLSADTLRLDLQMSPLSD